MTTAPAKVDLAALLGDLVRRDGIGLLDDRARMHGLLRDYAPDSVAGIRTLMTAYDHGVVTRLRDGPMPLPPGAFEREAASVAGTGGCDAASAAAAVTSWVRVVASARTGSAGSPMPLPLPLPAAGTRRARSLRLAGGIGAALAMGAVAARMLGYF